MILIFCQKLNSCKIVRPCKYYLKISTWYNTCYNFPDILTYTENLLNINSTFASESEAYIWREHLPPYYYRRSMEDTVDIHITFKMSPFMYKLLFVYVSRKARKIARRAPDSEITHEQSMHTLTRIVHMPRSFSKCIYARKREPLLR